MKVIEWEKRMQSKGRKTAVTQSECFSCGATGLIRRIEHQQFTYGDGPEKVVLTAEVPVWSCVACEEEFTGEEAETARHFAVCEHLGVLTPYEIKQIREVNTLTQEEFASLSDIGIASIKRWESGASIQSRSFDKFLRLLRFPENVRRLRQDKNTNVVEIGEPKFQTEITENARKQAQIFELYPIRRNEAA